MTTPLDYEPIDRRGTTFRLPAGVTWAVKLGPVAFATVIATLIALADRLPHLVCCGGGNALAVAAGTLIAIASTLAWSAEAWQGPSRALSAAAAGLAACVGAGTVLLLLALRA